MNTLFFFYNNFQNSFEINYNIFDTNVINLVIVLIIVIKFLGEAVFNTLEQRKQEISMNLQNSNRKVLIVNEKLNTVKLKLDFNQQQMKNVHNLRFSTFIEKKKFFLNQVKIYLDQLESLQNDIIKCQIQKTLSDAYNYTIFLTFDILYEKLLLTFKQSTEFSYQQKSNIAKNYLIRLR